jgi:hypothetical protein
LDFLSLQQKCVPGVFLGGKVQPMLRPDNMSAAYCQENVGASMSHNPMDRHGLQQLQLYFLLA